MMEGEKEWFHLAVGLFFFFFFFFFFFLSLVFIFLHSICLIKFP
jgi:hypothetical protein